MTGLKAWDGGGGGGGDQDSWNLENPYFYPADHTPPPRYEGCWPRRGFSVLQPSVVVVGARTQTGATIGRTLPSGLCKCPEDRRAIVRDVPHRLEVCHVTADSTNEPLPPSYRLSSSGTHHHRAVHSFHQFLICAYLVSILCSPYVSSVPDDLCLSAALSQIPFFSFPPSFVEKDLRTVAHEATWLTRVTNSSQIQYYSSIYNVVVNNVEGRHPQPALPTSAPSDPPCASPAQEYIHAQPSQPLRASVHPTTRFRGRVSVQS